MLPRERIRALLDPGSPFLEFSPLAAHGMYDGQAPGAGIVTGIGRVHGQEVVVVANDATVKGGTYFPITVKKHLRAQEIARENHLPCIYLVDSGGAFLPLQDEVFPGQGALRPHLLQPGAAVRREHPPDRRRHGQCTAGGAYVPAMCDESIIVKEQGTIFLGGPPLVKAATGEVVDAEIAWRRRSAHDDLRRRRSFRRERRARAADRARHRRAISTAPRKLAGCRDPAARTALPGRGDLRHRARATRASRSTCAKSSRASSTAREFQEFKARYGKTLVCGFAHIHGYPVGIVANNGILFSESALKGAHFIELCNQRDIPLVFLQNITGFMVGKKYENAGIAKDGAKMVTAVACSRVPKFTVVIGGSFRRRQLRDVRPRLPAAASCGCGRTRASA